MVLKVTKGGVRSGNTLRGLHTLKTHRYSRHACLIGRSSLSAREVTRLVQSSSDDTWVTDTLGSTDVLLSLNKKQRWHLPDTFGHMIQTGCFNPKTTVSLLERHKLKRRANCVRYLSNKGKLREVAPKDKRYFTLNPDNIDSEKSNREQRRQRAKNAMRIKKPKEKIDYKSNIKTATVYTMDGPEKKEITSPKAKAPEYIMEVFYPCPKSCSLTFNPKYTHVSLEEGEDGTQEVKKDFVASQKKSKSWHRKRLTNAKWGLTEYEKISADVDQMWDEVYQDECSSTNVDSTTSGDVESDNQMGVRSFYEDEDIFSWEKPVPGKFLTDLISQAEHTREMCSRQPIVQPNKVVCATEGPHGKSLHKSHIIVDAGSNSRVVREKHTSSKEDNVQYTDLSFSRVILSSEKTSPEHLRSKYGQLYSEAGSEPRRFAINISDDIKRILNPTLRKNNRFAYLSYLVFVHDGVYDNNYDTFRVAFNSYICKNTQHVCDSLAGAKHYSLDDLMNHLFDVLLDMKEDGDLTLETQYVLEQNCITTTDIINQQTLCSVETFRPSDEIARIAFSDRMQEAEGSPTKLHTLVSLIDDYIFCEICYDNVNHMQLNSVHGTKLSRCDHVFCDDCWRSHIRTKLRDGAMRIVCPGYDCDATVGPVTLLSLIHITELGQLLQRSCEDQVEISANSKWCPVPECGRVIRLDVHNMAAGLSYDVTCACGVQICFSCLGPAHWPAKCEQAENYMAKLTSLKPLNEHQDEQDTPIVVLPQIPKRKKVPDVVIEGCKCPRCLRFIQKNGGCPHMICKCGHSFCWQCLRPYSHHSNGGSCTPSLTRLFEMQTKVVVHHIEQQHTVQPLETQEDNNLTKTKTSTKQKASMYQRALQQRQEKQKKVSRTSELLAFKISTKAGKDLNFKRELLSHCGLEEIPLDAASLALIPTLPHVRKLLLSCQKIKDALHHVTEFTFVLLQHVPNSVEKQRVLRLANDLSGYCSFFRSIFDAGDQQDAKAAVSRLMDIQLWAKRGLDALLVSAEKFRC